jgi:hypothetical protein
MLRASLGFLLLLFICLEIPPSLKAQRPGTGRVSGGVIEVQVRYATGEPGPGGIHIRLDAAEGGAAGDCQTRDGGRCQFNLSSSGVYLVRMSERGYKEVTVRVELISTTRPEHPAIPSLPWTLVFQITHVRNTQRERTH